MRDPIRILRHLLAAVLLSLPVADAVAITIGGHIDTVAYSCPGATGISFTPLPNPLWRWTCISTEVVCAQSASTATFDPVTSVVLLDCTSAVALFQNGFE